MKSMKKMLCLLLVAMLLVAAIPVAASATGEVGATEVTYSVVFQVKKGSGDFKDSLPVAYFNISSSASTEEVRAAAQAAVAAAGISSVDANTIVNRVAAVGQTNANYVYDIIFGNIDTYVTDSHEYYFILNATDRPRATEQEVDGTGKIYLDAEGNGRFVDSTKFVTVKMVEKSYEGTDSKTYTLAPNGGANVDKIRSALGADYKNANLSVTSSGPSTSNEMIYYVTVLGTNGTTGTNVPTVDGSTGGSSSNNGGSSSNNGGSSSNNGGTGTVAQFKVTFLNVNGVEFYSEYVAANGTIAASADFLNSSVGTKAGYEHIGWKANSGSTKTTNVVLTDKINANVTYAPVFKSLADNRVVIPGGGSSTTSNGNSSSSGTTTNKFPYPVYLNIYKDTLVGSPDKRVEITNGIALDGLVSLEEAKTVVKNYYTAKDSDGISYDGLYIAEGNWVADYVADTAKYNSIDAGSMRQTGTVYINVMIGNAKAKTSATADSSNPKTGDTIFVPFMVMGVTATALAAAYVFGKKRIAR